MNAEFIPLALVVAAMLATVVGFFLGHRRGVDEGWMQHYFHTVAQDRARRHRNGQFKAKQERRA